MEAYRLDLLQALRDPDMIMRAPGSALGAVRKLTGDRHVVVLYREARRDDGFVITGWLTTRPERFAKWKVLWTRPSSS